MKIRSFLLNHLAPAATGSRAAAPAESVCASPADSVTLGAAPSTASAQPVAPNIPAAARPVETAVALSATSSPACACAQEASAAAAPKPGALTAKLKALLPDHPFVISAQKAQELMQQLHLNADQLLQALVPVAQEYARPPVSNYKVGAAGMGASGNIYLGVNAEFPGNALNQTWHGEQCVVNNALANGEERLASLAVSAAPCGHCRQYLNEINDGKDLRILTPNEPPRTLSQLLPESFGPADLGVTGALLTHQDQGLKLLPGQARAADPELTKAAFAAANSSYAPYSHDGAGVAVRLKDGSVFTGRYSENAAFNPSLSPLQSALMGMVYQGRSYADIKDVVLVERRDAKASQLHATLTMLDSVQPEARLYVVQAEPYVEPHA